MGSTAAKTAAPRAYLSLTQAKCGCQSQTSPTMEWRYCLLHAAAPGMAELLLEISERAHSYWKKRACAALQKAGVL